MAFARKAAEPDRPPLAAEVRLAATVAAVDQARALAKEACLRNPGNRPLHDLALDVELALAGRPDTGGGDA